MNREIRHFILFFGMSFVIFGAIAFTAILIFFVNSNASYEIATTMLYICLIVSAANALLSGVLFKLWEECRNCSADCCAFSKSTTIALSSCAATNTLSDNATTAKVCKHVSGAANGWTAISSTTCDPGDKKMPASWQAFLATCFGRQVNRQ